MARTIRSDSKVQKIKNEINKIAGELFAILKNEVLSIVLRKYALELKECVLKIQKAEK